MVRIKRSRITLLVFLFLCFSIQYWVITSMLYIYGQVQLIHYKNTEYQLKNVSNIKFILLWQNSKHIHQQYRIFPKLGCDVSDCVFSEDRGLLGGDYRHYDAIVFNENALVFDVRPQGRLPSQIYIFNTVKPSYEVPACELFSEDFYNWTFTYRLESDIVSAFFAVRNLSSHIVAPKTNAKFQINLDPIDGGIGAIIATKTKAVAWVVEDCQALECRDKYFLELKSNLSLYSLNIDIYGRCTKKYCRGNCDKVIKDDYYFYLAFESAFAEDYVTRQVVKGYSNYAVPIVYGGADYSKFLPPNSYINARAIEPSKLSILIRDVIKTPALLLQYYKWTNSYTFDTRLYHPLCDLCAALHSDRAKHAPAQKQFRSWWNGVDGMKFCLPAVI